MLYDFFSFMGYSDFFNGVIPDYAFCCIVCVASALFLYVVICFFQLIRSFFKS